MIFTGTDAQTRQAHLQLPAIFGYVGGKRSV
jgi:hypothetical protein